MIKPSPRSWGPASLWMLKMRAPRLLCVALAVDMLHSDSAENRAALAHKAKFPKGLGWLQQLQPSFCST